MDISNINQALEMSEAAIFVSLNELKKRNLSVQGKRTSVTLEPQIWSVLHDVAEEQDCDIHELCTFIHERKTEDSSLASAIRVFLISYLNIQVRKGRDG